MSSGTPQRRGRVSSAVLLGGGMASFVVAGVMAATPASAGKGGAPPGSNGTIKVEGAVIDGGKDNDPHVSCPFQIELWGFDAGADTATVSFAAQPPSKTSHGSADQAVPASSGSTTLSFTGAGDAQHLDASQTYTLDTTGLFQHPKQGFHIKVTVVVTSASSDAGKGHGNQGTTTKYKVFWMGPCASESSSSSSSSSTTSSTTTTTESSSESATSTETTSSSVSATSTETTSSSSASVLGEKVTRKPPTTKVKATHVTQLPFTGLPSDVLRVLVPAALGLVLTGSGLLGVGRRSRARA